MSITVARYTFSSWLRKGIGARITEIDHLGGGASAVKERSHRPDRRDAEHRDRAQGLRADRPGRRHRHQPAHGGPHGALRWITNFEPNYLAFIEFYDEDFLWRYTPAKANGDRLRPWLALLVLEEGATPAASEFTKNAQRLPLPSVTVKAASSFPPHDQNWAWGHMHINQGYDSATEFEQFLLSLHDLNTSERRQRHLPAR